MSTRTFYSDPSLAAIDDDAAREETPLPVASATAAPARAQRRADIPGAPRQAPPAPGLTRRARRLRKALGILLVLHGLAHAAPGMWVAGRHAAWLVTPLWLVAMGGFLAAGFGVLGVAGLRRRWPYVVTAAGIASLLLLMASGGMALAIGLAVNIALVIAVLEADATAGMPDELLDVDRLPRPLRVRRAIGATLAWALLGWTALTIGTRPWHMNWGATEEDRSMRLPGDDRVRDARYRMDRAIMIATPAQAVWPWVAQIGQDRGGFYSYDRLERLIGDDIHNADRIHPEWQHRKVGDLVLAAQPGYLGGIFGDSLGWRVLEIEPGHAMVLEGWGAFVVRDRADGTTSLHVRLRQPGQPSFAGVLTGAAGLLAFEPAHFIMERAMLLGIRARAEEAAARETMRLLRSGGAPRSDTMTTH